MASVRKEGALLYIFLLSFGRVQAGVEFTVFLPLTSKWWVTGLCTPPHLLHLISALQTELSL